MSTDLSGKTKEIRLALWREDSYDATSDYLNPKSGLFPCPFPKFIHSKNIESEKAGMKKTVKLFKALGTFVAKSLLDSRIIDIPLSLAFFELVLIPDVKPSIYTLKVFMILIVRILIHPSIIP